MFIMRQVACFSTVSIQPQAHTNQLDLQVFPLRPPPTSANSLTLALQVEGLQESRVWGPLLVLSTVIILADLTKL